jgi:hypothetical protein
MSLKIIHDLSKLDNQLLEQYKRDVSVFIGLDPDLNGLDTIWMDNENGPGRSLVLYARRGTAEILREINKIEVSSLTFQEVRGSAVFTATGKNHEGRQEIATGSKSLIDAHLGCYLTAKALDNAIMTASTRALRRLTMQFTKLGILDVSEIDAVQGNTANPAMNVTLAGSAVVFPPAPSVPANNAPGRDITVSPSKSPEPTPTSATKAAINPVVSMTSNPVTPMIATVTLDSLPDIKAAEVPPSAPPETAPKPRRPRKSKNTVSMGDPEPEVVSTAPLAPAAAIVAFSPTTSILTVTAPQQVGPPILVSTSVPNPGTSVPNPGADFPDKPTDAQMSEYRKRISVYTSELPSSENMGSVQKMRNFLTRMTGTSPQNMTVDQWSDVFAFLDGFMERNQGNMKNLIMYIHDLLQIKS